MRQKCLDYIKKPSAKNRSGLTSMEQKWVDGQLKAEKQKDDKKPDKK